MSFKKMLEDKKASGAKPMSSSHMKAKSHVVGNLLQELSKMGGDSLGEHMKKITVAADSKAGLKAGLHKAAEIVDKGPVNASHADALMGDEESEEHEASESPEMEASEHNLDPEDMEEESNSHESPEALKARIAELEHELAKHKSSKFMG